MSLEDKTVTIRLSGVVIDVNKDWGRKNIVNFGSGGINLYSLVTAHASRHASGGADPVTLALSQITPSFGSENKVSLAAGASLTLPQGFWIALTTLSSDTSLYYNYAWVQVYSPTTATWHNLAMTNSINSNIPFAAFLASDGANARIYNSTSSAYYIYYTRVL